MRVERVPASRRESAPKQAKWSVILGTFILAPAVIGMTCSGGEYLDNEMACVECEPGFHCNGTLRFLCSPGTFCPGGSDAEDPCSAGSYCLETWIERACPLGNYCPEGTVFNATCPAGFFCSDPSNKTACELGSYCPEGSVQESECEAGSFCPSTILQVDCQTTIQRQEGVSTFFSHLNATHCRPGSSTISMCPAGSYCPNATIAIPCNVSSTLALSCPTGSRTPELCPAGSYCPEPDEERLCTTSDYCPEGSRDFALCQAGYFCENPTIQHKCTLGSFCPEGSTFPRECNEGHYCPNTTAEIQCKLGDYCPRNSTALQKCPVGRYCEAPHESELCEIGKYCPEGSSDEKDCKPGFYCPNATIQIACSEEADGRAHWCPPGSDVPEICPKGTTCFHSNLSQTCELVANEPAVFCAEGSKEEQVCDEGYMCTSPESQTECPNRTYCPVGTRVADPCPIGHFCPTPSQKFNCTLGFYCPEATQTPTKCSAGFFCPTTIARKNCNCGSYCPEGSTSENPCPAGSYCNNPANRTYCPPNFYCLESSTTPDACPANSKSAANATGPRLCICQEGYEGTIATPQDQCSAIESNTISQREVIGITFAAVSFVGGCVFLALWWRRRRQRNQVIAEKDIELNEKLGAGNFGETYRATYKGESVCVKIPKHKMDIDELGALMEITPHKNVMEWVGLAHIRGKVCWVTKLYDLGSLDKLHNRFNFTEPKHYFSLVHDICSGTAHLHSLGIVHRDIRCANVLLTGNLVAKGRRGPHVTAALGDWGLARRVGPIGEAKTGKAIDGERYGDRLRTVARRKRSPSASVSPPPSSRRAASPSVEMRRIPPKATTLDDPGTTSLRDSTDTALSTTTAAALGGVYLIKGSKCPWPWSAPETVLMGEHSRAADVYMIGVLMWEVQTRGGQPYNWSKIRSPKTLMRAILDNRIRLEFPRSSTAIVVSLARQCLEPDPEIRPDATQMKRWANALRKRSKRMARGGRDRKELFNTASRRRPAGSTSISTAASSLHPPYAGGRGRRFYARRSSRTPPEHREVATVDDAETQQSYAYTVRASGGPYMGEQGHHTEADVKIITVDETVQSLPLTSDGKSRLSSKSTSGKSSSGQSDRQQTAIKTQDDIMGDERRNGARADSPYNGQAAPERVSRSLRARQSIGPYDMEGGEDSRDLSTAVVSTTFQEGPYGDAGLLNR